MALDLEIQTYQILTTQEEVCIPSLSSILLAVLDPQEMLVGQISNMDFYVWAILGGRGSVFFSIPLNFCE